MRPRREGLAFVRTRLRSWLRVLASCSLFALLLATVLLEGSSTPGPLEYAALAASGYFALTFLYRSVRGDVLAVFRPAGLYVSGRVVPYPAIEAILRTEKGGVLLRIDQRIDPQGDLKLHPRFADMDALHDALHTVVFDFPPTTDSRVRP